MKETFLGLAAAVSDAVGRYYDHFDADYLRPGANTQISTFPRDLAVQSLSWQVLGEVMRPAHGQKDRFIDKSPDGQFYAENVRSCLLMRQFTSDAKFVFCRRNGIENISSRLRKWPRTSFIDHCCGWAGIMEAWTRVKDDLGDGFAEVDQSMVRAHPAIVADDLCSLLHMDIEQRDALHTFLSKETVEQTREDQSGSARELAQIDWRLAEKWVFLAICSPMMSRFGYEIGEVPRAHPEADVISLDNPRIQVDRIEPPLSLGRCLDSRAGFSSTRPGMTSLNPSSVSRSVPAWGQSRLRGALVHASPIGASVTFTLRVREPQAAAPLLERRFTLGPGEAHELDEYFTTQGDSVDIEVSTSINTWKTSMAYAWARVAGLSCIPV